MNNSANYSQHNDTEEYRYYDTTEIVFYFVTPWKKFLDGYLFFILGTITLFSNIALIYGMVDRKCVTSTAVLLLTLAFSISVSLLAQLPDSMYLILFGDATLESLPPDKWCTVLEIFYSIKNITISSGNWTTVFLAIQRCVVVFYPFRAAILFTIRRTLILQAVNLCLCCLLHVYTWIIMDIPNAELWIDPGLTHSCFIDIRNIPDSSSPVNTIFTDEMTRHAIQYVVPCIFLTVATFLLVYRLRKASKSIPGGITPRTNGSNAIRNSRMTKATKFVLSILLLFLLNQTVQTAIFGVYMRDYLFNNESLSNKNLSIIETVMRYLTLLTYQCIFWIFVMMSDRFRRSIKSQFSRYLKKSSTREPPSTIVKY